METVKPLEHDLNLQEGLTVSIFLDGYWILDIIGGLIFYWLLERPKNLDEVEVLQPPTISNHHSKCQQDPWHGQSRHSGVLFHPSA